MKLFAPLLAAFVLLLQPSAVVGKSLPPIYLATGDDYPVWTDNDLPNGGLATWLMTRAFEVTGKFSPKIVWVPWNIAIERARTGKMAGTFPWMKDADREKTFYFSMPFLPTTNYAWTLEGSGFTPTSIHDLRGKRFCYPFSYGDFGLQKELIKSGGLIRTSPTSIAACIRLLVAGKVDFVSAAPSEMSMAARKNKQAITNFRRSAFVLFRQPLHLMVSKKNPKAKAIIETFNQGFNLLKENSEWDEMKAQFDWKE